MYPYKVQISQKLHDGDFERHADFCSWFLQKEEWRRPYFCWKGNHVRRSSFRAEWMRQQAEIYVLGLKNPIKTTLLIMLFFFVRC